MSTSRDSLIGFPPFMVSTTASARAFSWISRAMRKMYFDRSLAGSLLQTFSYACRAALTARSTSSASASAMSASLSSVAGFSVSNHFPECGSTNFPPMKRL
jgi:hypothetical protein